MFSLFITKDAESFLKSKSNDSVFSLSVKDSGCSGYKYDFKTLTNVEASHKFQGIPFLIEEKNYKFLNNLLIDYKKEGLNQRLVFENPNSENECGCGESFGLKKGI